MLSRVRSKALSCLGRRSFILQHLKFMPALFPAVFLIASKRSSAERPVPPIPFLVSNFTMPLIFLHLLD